MKIAICGTHCSGKSTLVNELSTELNLPRILEVAGTFKEEERQELSTQLDILHLQIQNELENESFISDRSVIDNSAYIYYHSMKQNMPNVYMEAKKFINQYLTNHPYNLIIFINEYFPLENNGIRNMDGEQQIKIYNFIEEILPGTCSQFNIPLIVINGSNEKRKRAVMQWLTEHSI